MIRNFALAALAACTFAGFAAQAEVDSQKGTPITGNIFPGSPNKGPGKAPRPAVGPERSRPPGSVGPETTRQRPHGIVGPGKPQRPHGIIGPEKSDRRPAKVLPPGPCKGARCQAKDKDKGDRVRPRLNRARPAPAPQ